MFVCCLILDPTANLPNYSNHRNGIRRILPWNLRNTRALEPLHPPSRSNHTPETRCIRLEHGSSMGRLRRDSGEGERLDQRDGPHTPHW